VRIFLDTNVLVSAFAARGLSTDVFELVRVRHELVTGRAVLVELERALRVKVKLPPDRCTEIVAFVSSEAVLVVGGAKTVDCNADAEDRLVLGEAIEGQADLFVTGDAAVVSLGKLGAMQILTPRQLWERLSER